MVLGKCVSVRSNSGPDFVYLFISSKGNFSRTQIKGLFTVMIQLLAEKRKGLSKPTFKHYFPGYIM